jgi:hypothetical protein
MTSPGVQGTKGELMSVRFNLLGSSRRTRASFLALSLCTATACSPPDEGVGTAQLAIAQVPTDTRCIRITVAGTRQVARAFTVTPGESATFALGQLPLGPATFSGEAFPAVCSQVGSASVPGWVSDPVQAVVTVSPPVEVVLLMRRNGRGSVSVDFEDDPVGGGAASPFATEFSSSADVDLWLADNPTLQKTWDANEGDPAPGSLAFRLVDHQTGTYTVSRLLTSSVDLSGKTVRARIRLDLGTSVFTVLSVMGSSAPGAPSEEAHSNLVELSSGIWTTISLVVNNPAEATPAFDSRDVDRLLVIIAATTTDEVRGYLDTVVVE